MGNYYLSKFFDETELQKGAAFLCDEGLNRLLMQGPGEAWQAVLQLAAQFGHGSFGEKLKAAREDFRAWPARERMISSHWGPLLSDGKLSPVLALAGMVEFHRHEQGASSVLGHLADSPLSSKLEILVLDRAEIGDATFTKFCQSQNFTSLAELKVHNFTLGKDALHALLTAPFLTQLKSLQLSKIGLDAGFCRGMLERLPKASISYLNLNGNRIGSDCIESILSSGILASAATCSVKGLFLDPVAQDNLRGIADSKKIELIL